MQASFITPLDSQCNSVRESLIAACLAAEVCKVYSYEGKFGAEIDGVVLTLSEEFPIEETSKKLQYLLNNLTENENLVLQNLKLINECRRAILIASQAIEAALGIGDVQAMLGKALAGRGGEGTHGRNTEVVKRFLEGKIGATAFLVTMEFELNSMIHLVKTKRMEELIGKLDQKFSGFEQRIADLEIRVKKSEDRDLTQSFKDLRTELNELKNKVPFQSVNSSFLGNSFISDVQDELKTNRFPKPSINATFAASSLLSQSIGSAKRSMGLDRPSRDSSQETLVKKVNVQLPANMTLVEHSEDRIVNGSTKAPRGPRKGDY